MSVYTIYGQSDVGVVRDNNEDAFARGMSPGGVELVCVADGMGGFEAGEIASMTAIDRVLEHWERPGQAGIQGRLTAGFRAANTAVLEESGRRGHAMGTTMVALALRGDTATIAHIGDSRVYRVRDGDIERLTRDHTEAQSLVDQGELTAEEAEYSDVGHILTRCIGIDLDSEPEFIGPMHVEDSDLFLLCSDGLSDMVEDPLIGEVLRYFTPREAADRLIELAKWRGGFDNITVQVVRAGDASAPLEEPPRGYRLEYEVSPLQRAVAVLVMMAVILMVAWFLLRL